ncbi:hypothetical protein BGW80DRAFT_788313 [Lactifluus volemus]|nr:hypothetical protein BGW80DRAFT_788313 [Lactifluus volemus]
MLTLSPFFSALCCPSCAHVDQFGNFEIPQGVASSAAPPSFTAQPVPISRYVTASMPGGPISGIICLCAVDAQSLVVRLWHPCPSLPSIAARTCLSPRYLFRFLITPFPLFFIHTVVVLGSNSMLEYPATPRIENVVSH